MRVEKFTYQGSEDERLDIILSDLMDDFSRSRVQSLIKDGRVRVAGSTVTKKAEKIPPGTRIQIQIPPPVSSELAPESIPLDIVYENDDLLVINKPAGMVVHPGAGHSSGTLVNAVLAYAPEIEGVGGVKRPGLVHRLDKETSGLILLAKNDRAHQFLQEQFQERKVDKIYQALVDGQPPSRKGRVEVAVGRDPMHRQRMAPVLEEDGKMAVSEYFTVKSFQDHTLLEVHILTGRTHQIRVHLAFLECPVVGDTTYGRKKPSVDIGRFFLHAGRLGITLPGESEKRWFEVDLPPELEGILAELKLE
ncbi:MAG: RluA family pseudouridine synthase [Anaerolineales bacterium]|nr:RluA family pseudouridine synthase [Anaerolineales bacterium]